VFLSVFVVYSAHVTSNVVRETYLALAMAERFTVKVDLYLGLHPDLFEIPSRGSYINSNPGASLLGAVPLLLSRPAVSLLFAAKPSLGAPKSPATYNDPRPNRTLFMNEMRRRGLDVRLAIAALLTQIGLMAPLGALAAVAVFGYVRGHGNARSALWLSLLYAFGTPLFFRSGFLNQNALLAHCVVFSWLLLTRANTGPQATTRDRDWLLSGLLLGFGVVLDYSAAPLALAFGIWSIVDGWQAGGAQRSLRRGASCFLGAVPMLVVLFAYQYAAFGSPWFPAQRYMPATEFSVRGWNGMTMPTVSLLWRNLLDLRYGLFAFCPLLVLALASTFRGRQFVSRSAVIAAASAVVALWLFNSANQFASLQWNTGVRYMVPAVPLLFVLAAPVLLSLSTAWRWVVVAPTLLISWAVAMMREDVLSSIRLLLTDGPTLPLLIVLRKTAAAYAPWLGSASQPIGVLSVSLLLVAVAVLWRTLWDATSSPADS